MPRTLNIKDNDTGANARVTWYGNGDPTDDDIKQIFDEQHRRSKEAVDKVANAPLKLDLGQKITQGIGSIPIYPGATIGDAAQGLQKMIAPIESSPYLPNLHNIVRTTEGVKRLVTGKGLDDSNVRDVIDPSIDPDYYRQRAQLSSQPPQNPRTLGAEEALTGGLGLSSVALPSAAIAAPIETLLRLGAGYGASKLTQKVLPKNLAPEQRDLASTVAGILAGSIPFKLGPRPQVESPTEDASPGPSGPNVDPKSGPNVDPKSGPNVDPKSGPNVDPKSGPNVQYPKPQDTSPIALPPAGTHALEAGKLQLHPAVEASIPDVEETPQLHPAIDKALNDTTDFKPSQAGPAVQPQTEAPNAGSPVSAPTKAIVQPPANTPTQAPSEPTSRAPQDTQTELHPAISKVLEEPQETPKQIEPQPTDIDITPKPQTKKAKPKVTYKKVEIPTASSQMIADAKDPFEELKLDKLDNGPVPEPKVKSSKEEHLDATNTYLDHLDMLADHPDEHDSILPKVSQLAQQVRIKPKDLEEDLRSSGVPEEKIDQVIQQTYPDIFKAEIEGYENDNEEPEEVDDSEKGSFSLAKKGQHKAPKPRKMMSVQTGLISKRARQLNGMRRTQDQFLSENPIIKPLVDDLKASHYGAGGEEAWKYYRFKKLDEDSKGLSGDQWKELFHSLDGKPSKDPKVEQVSKKWRAILESAHSEMVAKGVTQRSGKPLGHITEYITHIMHDETFGEVFKDQFKNLFEGNWDNIKDKLFGSKNEEVKAGYGVEGVGYQGGTLREGFTETRKGEPAMKETDARIVMHKYMSGVARILFRKPLYERGIKLLDKIPNDSPDKWFATQYLKDYVGTADNQYIRAIKNIDQAVASMGANAYLSGSIKLQILHLARTGLQIIPEVGPINWLNGVARAVQDPKGLYRRAVSGGLLPQQALPMTFKGLGDKMNMLAQIADFGNMITKVLALSANEHKLMEAKDPNWAQNAIYETARQEGVTGKVHPIPILDWVPLMKNLLQFKHFAFKAEENMEQAIKDTIKNPKKLKNFQKLGLYVAAFIAAYEIQDKTRAKLLHVGGRNMAQIEPIVIEEFNKFSRYMMGGKYGRAITGLAQYLGGAAKLPTKSLTHIYPSGQVTVHPPDILERDKPRTESDSDQAKLFKVEPQSTSRRRGRRVVRRRPR